MPYLACTTSLKKEDTLTGFKDIQKTIRAVHEMPIAVSQHAGGNDRSPPPLFPDLSLKWLKGQGKLGPNSRSSQASLYRTPKASSSLFFSFLFFLLYVLPQHTSPVTGYFLPHTKLLLIFDIDTVFCGLLM